MTKIYFFDSYALLEIQKGNPAYIPYTEMRILLTKLNLFEVYYALLKDVDKKAADTFLQAYLNKAINYGYRTIREAATFRHTHKKRKLSMTDCIGYTLAKHFNIPFLTGDQMFKNMEGVEFVK